MHRGESERSVLHCPGTPTTVQLCAEFPLACLDTNRTGPSTPPSSAFRIRLHDAKRVVRVYDYVDSYVLMLARMYARRLKGYSTIGYKVCDAREAVVSGAAR